MVRYFTLDEANALLPRLRARLFRAMQLQVLIQRGIDTLADEDVTVTAGMLSGKEPSGEESSQVLDRTRAAYEALYDELEAIEEMGIQLKALEEGLVDFPSLLEGQTEVLLCWRLGEAEVGYYHHAHSGFAGRKPVRGRAFARVPSRPRQSP